MEPMRAPGACSVYGSRDVPRKDTSLCAPGATARHGGPAVNSRASAKRSTRRGALVGNDSRSAASSGRSDAAHTRCPSWIDALLGSTAACSIARPKNASGC